MSTIIPPPAALHRAPRKNAAASAPRAAPRGGLALLGGTPVRTRAWPTWPRADAGSERALVEVLHSGRWALSGASTGKPSFERRFAAAFAAYHGIPHCTPTTSGTAALTLALLALEVGPGDEVLVPGLTWVACASAVIAIGAVPILVDIDRDTLALSPHAAAAAITPRTRAIMLVHPFCTLAAIHAFLDLSARTGIPLVEDCSQAHGAKWNGRRVGTFGAVGCFSMQQSKVLTCGEGGAAITSDPRLSDRMEQLRSDGRRFTAEPVPGRLELVEVGDVLGRNLCMSEFHAALLLDRLQHLDAENHRRAARAAEVERRLDEAGLGVSVLPAPLETTARTYYNLALRFDLLRFDHVAIDTIGAALAAELNTAVNPIYRPMNRHPLYQPLKASKGGMTEAEWMRRDPARFALPEAEAARAAYLTLTHPVLLDDEVSMADIVEALAKVSRHAPALHTVRRDPSLARQAF